MICGAAAYDVAISGLTIYCVVMFGVAAYGVTMHRVTIYSASNGATDMNLCVLVCYTYIAHKGTIDKQQFIVQNAAGH